jgi:hypothetical protein
MPVFLPALDRARRCVFREQQRSSRSRARNCCGYCRAAWRSEDAGYAPVLRANHCIDPALLAPTGTGASQRRCE